MFEDSDKERKTRGITRTAVRGPDLQDEATAVALASGEQARRLGARLCWHGFWGDDMGLHVDRLSGEYVDVEIADTEVLQAIAEDYHDRLAGKQGRLWPWERRWLASNLNIIIEELVVRSHEEPS